MCLHVVQRLAASKFYGRSIQSQRSGALRQARSAATVTQARGGGGGQQVTVKRQLWRWAAALPVSERHHSSLKVLKVTVPLAVMQPDRSR